MVVDGPWLGLELLRRLGLDEFVSDKLPSGREEVPWAVMAMVLVLGRQIRPVWHQRADRVRAHILVCFLAYVLWKALGQMSRMAGWGDEPRKVFEELAISLVEVALPTRRGITIRKRCISRPTEHQAILLHRLGLKLPSAIAVTGM